MLKVEEFKKLFDESAETMAEVLAQEKTNEKDILPAEARKKKIQHEIEDNAEMLQTKMYEGLKACIQSVEECSNLPMTPDALKQELVKCFESIKGPDELAQLGMSTFLEKSWKDQLGISSKCIQTLYQGAKVLFEKKEFSQAAKAFFVICSLDPTQFENWIGLGHSSYQVKNYEQAINAYAMACTLDSENVWPHIWAANCYEAEGDFEYAKMALDEALSLEKERTPKNAALIRSLEERINKIQNK